MKKQTLREELQKITAYNQTATAITNKLSEDLRWAAEEGVYVVDAILPKDVEFEVLANLTNEYCGLTCECVDEEQGVYEISWD